MGSFPDRYYQAFIQYARRELAIAREQRKTAPSDEDSLRHLRALRGANLELLFRQTPTGSISS